MKPNMPTASLTPANDDYRQRHHDLEEAVAKAFVTARLAVLARDCEGVLGGFDRRIDVVAWAQVFALDAARELFCKYHGMTDEEAAR